MIINNGCIDERVKNPNFIASLGMCPYLYSGDLEDILNDGESREIVLDSMKNSIGYTGNSCYFEFKKYVKKNRSKFPNFYMMLTD